MKQILFVLTMLFSIVANAYEPLIREDRIWVYNWTGNGNIYFKFDGTVFINGYTYHKLNACNKEYPYESGSTFAYMREDESRGEVHTILMQDNLKIVGLGDADICDLNNIEKNTEILLYEFLPNYSMSLIPAMTEFTPYTAIEDLSLIMSHTRRTTINLNNRDWKISQYTCSDRNADPWPSVESAFERSNCSGDYYITIVEGVGNIGRGLLHLPSYRPMLTSMGDFHHYEDSRFVRMTDLEGNVIFDASWLDKNGVEETEASGSQSDGQAYDLSGKPTSEPAPGTVYIRNGRKEIAR